MSGYNVETHKFNRFNGLVKLHVILVLPIFNTPHLSETEVRYEYVLELENIFLKLGNTLKYLKPVKLIKLAQAILMLLY
jgi:hypothetical protein